MTKGTHYFYGERGDFKLEKPRSQRIVVIVAIRQGSVRLLKPPSDLWSLRSRIVAAGTVLGSLIAYFTIAPFESLGASFALSVLGSFLVLLAVIVVVVDLEERWFWPHVARQTPDPGFDIQIERVEYRHFYHHVVATSAGHPVQLTIGGLPRRVRRALSLVGVQAVSE